MLKTAFFCLLLILCLSIMALAAVNLNTADVGALESIKNIGPKKAQAIVEYRDSHGPFKSVDELTNVKGIGPKLLEQIRDQIEVGPSGKE